MTVTEQPSLTGSSEFAERVLDVLNSGMLALMISIGHRSGLFDAMAALPPATSGRIAQVAGLDERYVREWLAAMTTGRIVDHDPAAMTFTLPPAHAAWLTRAAGGMGLGTMWGEQTARRMLAAAGFTEVDTKHVDGDILNTYYIATRSCARQRHLDGQDPRVGASNRRRFGPPVHGSPTDLRQPDEQSQWPPAGARSGGTSPGRESWRSTQSRCCIDGAAVRPTADRQTHGCRRTLPITWIVVGTRKP